jgi:hypothetical protein
MAAPAPGQPPRAPEGGGWVSYPWWHQLTEEEFLGPAYASLSRADRIRWWQNVRRQWTNLLARLHQIGPAGAPDVEHPLTEMLLYVWEHSLLQYFYGEATKCIDTDGRHHK